MIDRMSPDFLDIPGRRKTPRMYSRWITPFGQMDISILTPYFNTEEFFLETFASLSNQSLQNWEWIIVDDGSTDSESVERLLAVANQDNRIQVIRQENVGPGGARNTAFRKARGRYICLLDSDDMLEPTYLEKCAWFLDSNPEFAFCNSYSIVFGEQEYLWSTGFERGAAHLQANSGPPISVVRHAAYAAAGGFDESIRFGHEDWDFWLSMAKSGHWGHTIPEYLQWYRKRSNGRFEQIMSSGTVNDEFEKLMHRKYPDLANHFPKPVRRPLLSYESIRVNADVSNSLGANTHGRRIMFIIPWMVTGGADRVNLDLIEGLVQQGHEITVCATLVADHRWEHQFSRFTPDIFILPNILGLSDYPRFLAYLIQSRRIDSVVITGSTIGYQLLPYLRAVSAGVSFIDMCHVEEPHWQNGGHPRFAVGYQDLLDLNIVTTQHLAEWMVERGADIDRVKVMYTGIRTPKAIRTEEQQLEIRKDFRIPKDVPIIVFAGRICEQKRPALLAEILRTLRDDGTHFHALIIGDGELKAKFEALLEQYGLNGCVSMLGSVAHQRWLEILVVSDILLMPSQYEGISIALLEAMAAGVVPVVAKVGGQEEIVNEQAGVLIGHGDGELGAYVSAIRRLLSDKEVIGRMSVQCRMLIGSKLSWASMITSFQRRLDEAHQLRVTQSRNPISFNLACELTSQSIECKRLGDTADWLWNANPHSAKVRDPSMPSSAEAQAVAKYAILLSQTWIGRKIIRSSILRAFGKKLMKRMTTHHVA